MSNFYVFTGDKNTIPLAIKKYAGGKKVVYIEDKEAVKRMVTTNNLFGSTFYVTNIPASEFKEIVPKIRQVLAVIHDKGLVPRALQQYVVKVDAPTQEQIVGYIQSELSMTKELASYIASNCVGLIHASKEVEKFKSYKGTITKEVIDELLTVKLESKVFDLVNCTLKKDYVNGYRYFEELKKLREPSLKLLAVFYTLYRNTFIVVANNTSEVKVLCEKTGLSYYQVKMILENTKNMKVDNRRLLTTLQAVFKVEVMIKTGKMEEKVALEHLMLWLFS